MGTESNPLCFNIRSGEDGQVYLDFSTPDDQKQLFHLDTLVDITLDLLVNIIKTEPGKCFRRDILEELLSEVGQVPCKRSLDDAFARLPEIEGVTVERNGLHKYYGWSGDAGQPGSRRPIQCRLT